jgi:hypothetical protein
VVEAPGFAPIQWQFQKLARTRAFLVNLLIGTTFDVFIDTSGLHSSALKSTAFVEAFWRRREHVSAARRLEG